MADSGRQRYGSVPCSVTPSATGGKRFLNSAGNLTLQGVRTSRSVYCPHPLLTMLLDSIVDLLNAEPIAGVVVPTGDRDLLKGWKPSPFFSNEKSKEVLGAYYRPVEETIRDTITHALELGWSQ